MLPDDSVETWNFLTCFAPSTGSARVHHSEKNGRVRQTCWSRLSTATIEYMSGQPRLSVRSPRLGLAASAASVKSTVVIVLIRTCLVGNEDVTAFTTASPLASVIRAPLPTCHSP